MPELYGVKLEESIELNFPGEISSPPKSLSQCPIGIYLYFAFKKMGDILKLSLHLLLLEKLVDIRHQHEKQPQSFSEFPSVAISEMYQRKSLSPVKSVNAMKQLNERRPSPLNDVSHCPTGIFMWTCHEGFRDQEPASAAY